MNFQYLHDQLFPLQQLPCAWHIAGGWAIDLFLGRVTREHKDMDICLARRDQFVLQQNFPNCAFTYVDNTVTDSHVEKPWQQGEYLSLPMHEIWMRGDGYQLEFLLDEIENDVWISRRDHAVRLPLADAIWQSAATGIRFAAPHVALYFKAKKARDKDTADFLACRAALSDTQKNWLFAHIGADHPWVTLP